NEGGETYEHAGIVNPLYAWLESQGVRCIGAGAGTTTKCRYNLDTLAGIPALPGPKCPTSGPCGVLHHLHMAEECVPKAMAGVAGGCK
ncbi:MAG: hypothetical protein ACREP8_03945, partial [Candidatus Binatia bacterium]